MPRRAAAAMDSDLTASSTSNFRGRALHREVPADRVAAASISLSKNYAPSSTCSQSSNEARPVDRGSCPARLRSFHASFAGVIGQQVA